MASILLILPIILWAVIFSGSDLQPLTLGFLHSHLNINPPVQILFFFFQILFLVVSCEWTTIKYEQKHTL